MVGGSFREKEFGRFSTQCIFPWVLRNRKVPIIGSYVECFKNSFWSDAKLNIILMLRKVFVYVWSIQSFNMTYKWKTFPPKFWEQKSDQMLRWNQNWGEIFFSALFLFFFLIFEIFHQNSRGKMIQHNCLALFLQNKNESANIFLQIGRIWERVCLTLFFFVQKNAYPKVEQTLH